MRKLTAAELIVAAVMLALAALTFIVTPGAKQTGTSTRATVNPTEMMERAPRNLPAEQHDAY